jgi:hypothetical protein
MSGWVAQQRTQKIEPVAVAGEENGYLSAMYQISLDKNIGARGLSVFDPNQ